jgi:hypothetical protein
MKMMKGSELIEKMVRTSGLDGKLTISEYVIMLHEAKDALDREIQRAEARLSLETPDTVSRAGREQGAERMKSNSEIAREFVDRFLPMLSKPDKNGTITILTAELDDRVEQCAEICDGLAVEFRDQWKEEENALASETCARLIRELKEEE